MRASLKNKKLAKIVCWADSAAGQIVVDHFRKNPLFAGSTDTIFGLFAALTEEGKKSLDRIKSREKKPYIILIPSKNSLDFFISPDSKIQIETLIEHCWPGPLTLVLKAREDLAPFIQSTNGTVAIRVPQHAGIRQLLGKTGPLFSTSANRAGQPAPRSLSELDQSLRDALELIIINEQSDQPDSLVAASTILDCTGSQIKLIRAGAYDLVTLEKIMGKKIEQSQ